MSAPRIPGHTCPKIDKVIQTMDNAFAIADKVEGSDNLEDLQHAISQIRYCLVGESDNLEPIRAANLALRNAAEYWEKEAERLSAELDNAMASME